MNALQLIVDLNKGVTRQGPGGEAETRMSIALSGLSSARNLKIADIGCGTGTSTLVLAQQLDAHITAVDLVPEFLAKLEAEAKRIGAGHRVTLIAASMDALPFGAAELDAIWSEGAIYNMGFEAGVAAWRKHLKPDGILAVSELTWLTHTRPSELQAYWEREYSEVDTASAKLGVLEKHGFSPVGYIALPEQCWLDNFYRPIERRFAGFLEEHGHSEAARALVEDYRREIALYERYKAHFSYGYYIARKAGD